jgi:sulfotransferase
MDKTYFFMAGLPRSGSTLLSAILNQNPDIYVTPSADISFSILSIYETSKSSESHNAGFTPESYKEIIKSIPDMFYQHIDKPYIIDKNRSWGTPETFEVAELFTGKVKIICPVRPILEILASFVSLADKNPDNFIDKLATEYPVSQFRPINDARCDALMAANHQIEKQILSLASSLKPEHQDKFHFVAYADLVSKPERVIEAIYDFLEIPKFQHQFDDIEQPLVSNEAIQNGMPDMHTIRPKMDKSKTETSILSEYVHKKYGHALDFIFPNGIKDFLL